MMDDMLDKARAQLAAAEQDSLTDELGDFFVAPLRAHVAELEGMDDEINVSIRLDDDVALKLAMFAHDAGVTLNALLVAILEDDLVFRRLLPSRNKQQGRYVGRWRGRHVRSTEPWAGQVRLDSGIARAVRQQRVSRRVERILDTDEGRAKLVRAVMRHAQGHGDG